MASFFEAPEIEETTFLCGPQRHRRYGTTTTPTSNRPKYVMVVRHRISSSDTLQGLALKYGSSMTEIKRLNKLWSVESMYLKSELLIPVLSCEDATVPLDSASTVSLSELDLVASTSSSTVSNDENCCSSSQSSSGDYQTRNQQQNYHRPSSSTSIQMKRTPPKSQSQSSMNSAAAAAQNVGNSTTNFQSAKMEQENLQDMFSRIDKMIKTSKKEIKRIGRQSMLSQDDANEDQRQSTLSNGFHPPD